MSESVKKLQLQFGGHSIAGRKAENYDAFAACQPDEQQRKIKGAIGVIADGVSAKQGRQIASVTCVTNFINDYLATPESWSVKRSATRVLRGLNLWCLGQRTTHLDQQSDMSTTFSSLIFKATKAHLLHVGDSRIYRWQNQDLEQLTRDHNHGQGQQRFLTRAVGIDPHLDMDYRVIDLQTDDLFIFTTDGVHHFLSDKALAKLLRQPGADLEQLARQIVEKAEAAGSDDNLTCLLIRVTQLPGYSIDERYRQLTRLPVPPPLEPGMKLEGFRILQVLFSGPRSIFYKVIDEQNDKIYGLKTPVQGLADDPGYLTVFTHEAWIGQRIEHPNVMRVYPRPDNARFLYHVCEYIDGQTLRQWMRDNPRPPIDKVRDIISQLITALRKLQRLDMVHRDLKPENVMITSQGQVKLIDFGAVQAASLADEQDHFDVRIPMGAVNYIAPECILNQVTSHQSDIYSVAVICYEMLTGHLPYKNTLYVKDKPLKVSDWQYQSLASDRADLPGWINLTLKKALEPQPEKRYQAFSEMEMDLQQPNAEMLELTMNAPLLERNPVLFWQLVALIMLVLNLLQLLI